MTDQPGFFDVVYARRSVRQFQDAPVPVTVLERIVEAGLEAPTGCNAQLRRYIIVTDPDVMARLRQVSTAMKSAPAAIVQLIEPTPTKFGAFYLQDAAASLQNMLLATVASGYASCWVEGAVRHGEQEIRDILGVPPELNVSAILPIGKPAESPSRPAKLTLAEATHYDQFGRQGRP